MSFRTHQDYLVVQRGKIVEATITSSVFGSRDARIYFDINGRHYEKKIMGYMSYSEKEMKPGKIINPRTFNGKNDFLFVRENPLKMIL